MNKFIFKSPKRLVKNSPITVGILTNQMDMIQTEQRAARQDLVDIKLMLNKLLIDKHLQMQVDEYFEKDMTPPQDGLDWWFMDKQPTEDTRLRKEFTVMQNLQLLKVLSSEDFHRIIETLFVQSLKEVKSPLQAD